MAPPALGSLPTTDLALRGAIVNTPVRQRSALSRLQLRGGPLISRRSPSKFIAGWRWRCAIIYVVKQSRSRLAALRHYSRSAW